MTPQGRSSGRHGSPPIQIREPALWIALGGLAVKLVGAYWIVLSVDQQSVLNATVAALVGGVIAFNTRDGQSAAILGLGQALIALAIGFGLNMPADLQATVMGVLGLVQAAYVRTQVIAPVPARQ